MGVLLLRLKELPKSGAKSRNKDFDPKSHSEMKHVIENNKTENKPRNIPESMSTVL